MIKNAISFILPNEHLYIFDWATSCEVVDKNTGKAKKDSGVSYFTDKRFVYFGDDDIIDIPLEDICTVAAHKGIIFVGVSFRTPNLDIKLTFNYVGKNVIKLVRDMIIYISANPKYAQPANVIVCAGCAATVIIHLGTIGKCEYCERYADATL